MAQLPHMTQLQHMKPILDDMRRCVTESLGKCNNLQRNLNLSPGMELREAKQRIAELENEIEGLRRRLLISQSSSSAAAMTESLQMDVDRHLMKAKLENEELQDIIRRLKDENEHLKQQISAYQEDFETERRDRENAHSVIADLKNQIKILHERSPAPEPCTRPPHQFCRVNRIRGYDVCDSGRDVTDSPPSSSPSSNTLVVSNETDGLRSISPAAESVFSNNSLAAFDFRDSDDDALRNSVLTGRGVVDLRTIQQQQHGTTNGRTHNNPGVRSNRASYNNTGGCSMGYSSSGRRDFGASLYRQDSDEEAEALTLSCPNCRKRFSTEDHLLLIDHLEICN